MNKTILAAFVVALSLTGCQSTTEDLAEQQQIRKIQDEQFFIAKQAVDEFILILDKADKDNIAYFSPDNYKDAKKSYKEADEVFTEIKQEIGASIEDSDTYIDNTNEVLMYIAEAKGAITGAYLIKDTAETTLKESFEQKERLLELSVNTLYAKTYKDVNDDLSDLVEYIADGKLEKAQDKQVTLLKTMVALEVRAVKQIFLSKLTSKYNLAHKAKYHTTAPLSYKKASSAKALAEAVISSNPRAIEQIKKAVADATFEFDHLEHIALSIKKLKAIKKNQFETFILNYENDLNKISTAAGQDNLRNLSIPEQVKAIVIGIAAVQSSKEDLLAELEKTNATVAEKNRLLDLNAQNSDSSMKEMLTSLRTKEQELQTVELDTQLKDQELAELKVNVNVLQAKLNDLIKVETELATAKVKLFELSKLKEQLQVKELELMEQKLVNAELKGKVQSVSAQKSVSVTPVSPSVQ